MQQILTEEKSRLKSSPPRVTSLSDAGKKRASAAVAAGTQRSMSTKSQTMIYEKRY